MVPNVRVSPANAMAKIELRALSLSLSEYRLRKRTMAPGAPKVARAAQITPQEVMIRTNPQISSLPSNARGRTAMLLAAPRTSPTPRAMAA